MSKPISHYITPTLHHDTGFTRVYGALKQFPFLDFDNIYIFLIKTMFYKQALFSTSGKEAFNLVGPLDQAIFSHWANAQKHSICEDMCLRTNQAHK